MAIKSNMTPEEKALIELRARHKRALPRINALVSLIKTAKIDVDGAIPLLDRIGVLVTELSSEFKGGFKIV